MNKVAIRTPSFVRYKKLFFQSKTQSILRCLEYERLSELTLSGRVLDFGGGDKANYADEIVNWSDHGRNFTYESANIDARIKPSHILKKDGKIPVEANRYDTVLSLNTFEHVADLSNTFIEINRVLKPNGKLIFIVPFIFRVHGHPNDYLRGTPSFWEKILLSHLFGNIKVEAMNWGPFSTGLTVSGIPGPLKRLRLNLALLQDLFYLGLTYGLGVKLRLGQDTPICAAPIAYFFQAEKI